MDHIHSVADPSGSWLFERGDDSDAKYIRCPYCGRVVGLAEGADAPKICPSCKNAVCGSDKLKGI